MISLASPITGPMPKEDAMTAENVNPQPLCFNVWGRDFSGDKVIPVAELSKQDWAEICRGARFVPVSGCRVDELVSNELGWLYIIDSTTAAHLVDPSQFVGVAAHVEKPNERCDECSAWKAKLREAKVDREILLARADKLREQLAARVRYLERRLDDVGDRP